MRPFPGDKLFPSHTLAFLPHRVLGDTVIPGLGEESRCVRHPNSDSHKSLPTCQRIFSAYLSKLSWLLLLILQLKKIYKFSIKKQMLFYEKKTQNLLKSLDRDFSRKLIGRMKGTEKVFFTFMSSILTLLAAGENMWVLPTPQMGCTQESPWISAHTLSSMAVLPPSNLGGCSRTSKWRFGQSLPRLPSPFQPMRAIAQRNDTAQPPLSGRLCSSHTAMLSEGLLQNMEKKKVFKSFIPAFPGHFLSL